MSTTEPRATPGRADAPAGGTTDRRPPASGKPGSSGANGNAQVAVVASVESALAAVQQQLLKQADTVLHPPAPVPVAAPAPTAITATALRVREVAPAPDDRDDFEADFWGEPRRPTERRIDPDSLTRDERKALGKLRAKKVRRIVRHVSPWSVFKFSILFYLCLWLILMVAGVILWKLSVESGVVTNIEKFYAKAAGEKSFELDGRSLFRAGASAGVILVFAATAFTVLLAILFNLITDLTGGVKMTVLELESARRDLRRRPAAARVKEKATPLAAARDAIADEPAPVVAAVSAPAALASSSAPAPATGGSSRAAPAASSGPRATSPSKPQPASRAPKAAGPSSASTNVAAAAPRTASAASDTAVKDDAPKLDWSTSSPGDDASGSRPGS